ncbi:MAG: hypothetical protein GY757_37005, partial [bacterium]|nr:hypothetical protein [bacterium]
FVSNGFVLPTANRRKIQFSTRNVSRVYLEIKQVFTSNIGFFLHTQKLDSGKNRVQPFNQNYVNWVGAKVAADTLEIGRERNKWLRHELDLAPLIQPENEGLYLISLNFVQDDILYGTAEEAEEAKKNRRYEPSNPYSHYYIRSHGQIYKPLVLSDIGLTYKKADKRHIVYAT